MSKPTAAVKNRYNSSAYDRVSLMVPKGDKEKIREHAEAKGESINGYIKRLIKEDMK